MEDEDNSSDVPADASEARLMKRMDMSTRTLKLVEIVAPDDFHRVGQEVQRHMDAEDVNTLVRYFRDAHLFSK